MEYAMRVFYLLLGIISFSSSAFSQDAFKFREYLRASIAEDYGIFTDTVALVKDTLYAGEIIQTTRIITVNGKPTFINDYDTLTTTKIVEKEQKTRYRIDESQLKQLCIYNNWNKTNWVMKGCKVNLTPSKTKPNRLLINFRFPKKDEIGKEDYYIDLSETDDLATTYLAFSFSGQSIPFKYRPGFEKDTVKVKGNMQSQYNASLSFGFNIGITNYYYRKYEKINSLKFGLSFLVFTGPSLVTLKNSNTSTNPEKQLAEGIERGTGVLSLGYGVSFNIRSFSFGVFSGWDFAFGEAAQQWDYHARRWNGFGFGYTTSVNAIANALSFSPN